MHLVLRKLTNQKNSVCKSQYVKWPRSQMSEYSVFMKQSVNNPQMTCCICWDSEVCNQWTLCHPMRPQEQRSHQIKKFNKNSTEVNLLVSSLSAIGFCHYLLTLMSFQTYDCMIKNIFWRMLVTKQVTIGLHCMDQKHIFCHAFFEQRVNDERIFIFGSIIPLNCACKLLTPR